MIDTLFSDIERPGTVIVPHDYNNRRNLSIHVHTLQAQGHAVVVDEIVDANGRGTSGDLRVYHYKTCRRCSKRGAL
jgi:hypothetical protein